MPSALRRYHGFYPAFLPFLKTLGDLWHLSTIQSGIHSYSHRTLRCEHPLNAAARIPAHNHPTPLQQKPQSKLKLSAKNHVPVHWQVAVYAWVQAARTRSEAKEETSNRTGSTISRIWKNPYSRMDWSPRQLLSLSPDLTSHLATFLVTSNFIPDIQTTKSAAKV